MDGVNVGGQLTGKGQFDKQRTTYTEGDNTRMFYLDITQRCAKQHVDKHVVKMIVEYAQLLSTAHRVLDGEEYEGRTANNAEFVDLKWQIQT